MRKLSLGMTLLIVLQASSAAADGVLLGAGMRGDRYSVIFSSLADLTTIIQDKC